MYYQEAAENSLNKYSIAEQEDKLEDLEDSLELKNDDFQKARFMCDSYLVDFFQIALHSPEKLDRVYRILETLSKHPDYSLRLLLVKKLPRIALLCCGKDRLDYVSSQLWPLLLTCLPDKDDEVRKASDISLLVLIKGKLLDRETLEDQVCPLVVEMSKTGSYARVAALMGKMAPLIGKEATEKCFLDRFVQLCSEDDIVTREMCAKSLADMCTVLGTEITEDFLLPLFVQLSRDEGWAVRVSCAKVSVSVSCSCSLTTRKTVLASVFTDLLMDDDQDVRTAAFGFLGAFICTFADPSVTKLDYDENGELIFLGQDGYEFRMPNLHFNFSRDVEPMGNMRDIKPFPGEPKTLDQTLNISNAWRFIVENCSGHFSLPGLSPNQRLLKIYEHPLPEMHLASPQSEPSDNAPVSDKNEEADDSFNTFRFWRTPLPQLDSLDLEPEQDEIRTNLNILDNELSSLSEKLAECSRGDSEETKTESVISSSSSPDSGWNSAETTSHVESAPPPDPKMGDGLRSLGKEGNSPNRAAEPELPSQEIVPQLLLDYFVSMTVPVQAEMLDKEIAQDCAYCLPAVALTLGPSNWPYIKDAYKCLSMNIRWRVRRTLVSSIHKLASILGEEIASNDLAPIFEGFIRDLDEVKIGALEHLADFLKLVKPETRNSFLPRLKQFLETDFDWNWRYRKEFGKQLRFLIPLFGPSDWLEHFEPLATLLLCDKVAAVRHKAVLLFLDLLKNLSCEPHSQEKLLYSLLMKFAEHSSWRRRQVFVLICSETAKQNALGVEDFCTVLLEHLLLLSKDPVANVLIAVARCLSADVVSTGYVSPSSPHYSTVLGALEKLKTHSDPDVRYFASLHKEPKDANELNVPLLQDFNMDTQ